MNAKIFSRSPFSVRKGIPFYHEKTEAEFRADKYEFYEESVLRQTYLHFAAGDYVFKELHAWFLEQVKNVQADIIVELGCGVGSLIAELAKEKSRSDCYGVDYSYQMLKQGSRFYKEGKLPLIDVSNRGWGQIKLTVQQRENLSFLLARSEDLPFKFDTADVLCSSFLIDRVEVEKTLGEFKRVLKPQGKILLTSPLNFQKAEDWERYGTPDKLIAAAQKLDLVSVEEPRKFVIKEPLDANHNHICWNCFAFVFEKR